MVRVIGHVDLDYFYAQVEEVENPSLRGKPVLVCVFSGRTEDSGVVSTANYVARDFGVRSGMPIVLAKKKLEGRDAVFIPVHDERYEAVSDGVMQLVGERVDVLEKTGIDEAFFDITMSSGADYSVARTLAAGIKTAIRESHGLSASIGLGRSKIVAKIASDFMKPDGLTVVTPESTVEFLGPLPVLKLYGVGPKTAEALAALGIRTIGDLASFDVGSLHERLGRKTAAYLHTAARGEDEEPVTERQGPTQLSRIITLKRNTRDADEAFNELMPAMDDLHHRLVSNGTSFRTLSTIGVLTDLSVKTKSKTFENPVEDLSLLKDDVRGLLQALSGSAGREFRRVGIRVSELSSKGDQTSLTQFY